MVQPSRNNLFAFILGREQKIALLELTSVLRHFDFCFSVLSVVDNMAIIKIEPHRSFTQIDADNPVDNNSDNLETDEVNKLNPKKLMPILGGTIKIFQIVGKGSNDLIDDIANIIQENTCNMSGKLNFGISDYRATPTAASNVNKIGLSVKNILKKSHNTRFIALKEGNELASIVSYKNKLDSKGVEIGMFEIPNSKIQISNKFQITNSQKAKSQKPEARSLIGKLVAVTNPEEWSRRDYGKPRGDKYSGMMPPKLARMLVNLTLDQIEISKSKYQMTNKMSNDQNPKVRNLPARQCQTLAGGELEIRNYHDCVVLDPFCGSGNILMEAAMLGCKVVGSDVSNKAVSDTEENLKWLIGETGSSKLDARSYDIFVADATKFDFSEKLKAKSCKLAAIVTEPYLGSPKKFAPSLNAARGEYQKVRKLYIDFLKNISRYHSGLDPKSTGSGSRNKFGMTLCIIFPLVETQEGKQFSLFSECIDEIKEMGYTLIREPLVYGRQYQVVKREIVLLRSNTIVTQ